MEPTKRDLAVAAMDQTFAAAAAAVDRFIRGGGDLQTSGSAQFATLHLVTRALTDARWAQRAATWGYPIQAYSLLRPAWEAVQLCDLFAEKPELADAWAAGEYRSFTPPRVRQHLGLTDKDHFYSFMSERSHPRFAGLQMTIFQRANEEAEGRRQALVHMNDIPIEVSAAYEAVATPGLVLARLAMQAGRLHFSDDARKFQAFAPMIREVAAALRAGWLTMDAALDESERSNSDVRQTGEWADEVGALLDTLAAAAEEAGTASG